MRNKSKHSKQTGVTLVELMITMVIFAVIASAGIPAMTDFFARKSIDSVGPFFERTIRLARVAASDHGVDVRVRPISKTKDWSKGWFIEFTDPDDNNVKIIKTFDAINNSLTFTSDKFDDSTRLTIAPTGQVNTTGRFDLYMAPCLAGNGYEFNLLLSGIMNKGLITCS